MNIAENISWFSNRLFQLCAATILAFSIGLPTAHAAYTAKVYDKTSVQEIHEILRSEGYAASIDKDGDIQLKINGRTAYIVVSKNQESIRFSISFSGNGNFEKVNAWNRSYKYAQSYITKKGNPVMKLGLDLDGGVTRARIVDFLKTCRSSMEKWIEVVVR